MRSFICAKPELALPHPEHGRSFTTESFPNEPCRRCSLSLLLDSLHLLLLIFCLIAPNNCLLYQQTWGQGLEIASKKPSCSIAAAMWPCACTERPLISCFYLAALMRFIGRNWNVSAPLRGRGRLPAESLAERMTAKRARTQPPPSPTRITPLRPAHLQSRVCLRFPVFSPPSIMINNAFGPRPAWLDFGNRSRCFTLASIKMRFEESSAFLFIFPSSQYVLALINVLITTSEGKGSNQLTSSFLLKLTGFKRVWSRK